MPAGGAGLTGLRRDNAWHWSRAALLVGCIATLAGGLRAQAQDATAAARGEALFDGREPLVGRIRDHARDLPPAVLACTNCHAPLAQPQTPPNGAPVLDRVWLLTPVSWRNGPVSSYDEPSFCKAVQTGVDPRSIMLARAMPLVAVSATQCASLWAYLTRDMSQ